MATTRDQQRLMKIDGEIMELKYLYEREVAEEIRTDKSMFLCSRGIRHRLDKMIKARNLLCANMKGAMNSSHTFTLELAVRKEAVRETEDDLARLHVEINDAATLLATLKLGGTDSKHADNAAFHYKSLCRELPVAERRVRDKERAVNNWLERGKDKCQKMSDAKLGKFYDVQKDVDALYGHLPENDVKDVLEAINSRPKYNTENPETVPDFIAKAALEYRGIRETEAKSAGIDYSKLYSEGFALMNDQPKHEVLANEAITSEGRLDVVFKENKSEPRSKQLQDALDKAASSANLPSMEDSDV